MKIILIGFGTVGQGLVQILRDKRADLKARYGFEPQIVAVVTGRRGSLYSPDGLNLDALLSDFAAYPDQPAVLERGWSAERIIRESHADVLVEASPSNLETGQPALNLCELALQTGKHVVLANKGPVAVAYNDLMSFAQKAKRQVLFEGTVMAGTPSIRLAMQALQGCTITSARGILNGTTNYMLTQMESGKPYAEALAEAQALGYAEADPTADVEGWDAAGKARILAQALFGRKFLALDMHVQGISHLTPADIDAAKAAGERWKLIAQVTPQGASVQPRRIPVSHPLAGVSGTTNAVTYTTDLLGDVTLIGAGAGKLQTGFALLSDLLAIHQLG